MANPRFAVADTMVPGRDGRVSIEGLHQRVLEMCINDEASWNQVRLRDPEADGRFVYAVKTTGIYCRPTCGSRLPNRDNVQFFSTVQAAEKAGFRACRRCEPASPADPRLAWHEAIVQACRLIDQSESDLGLAQLASAVGISPFHFHKRFKQAIGVTPKTYAKAARMNRLKAQLAEAQGISAAVLASGFGSSAQSYRTAPKALGMTPSQYRKDGAGQTIRYVIAPCRLGWTLVAATDRGICMIELADSPDLLRERVGTKFKKANLSEASAGLDEWLPKVIAMIDAPSQSRDLPLDIQGTAFQLRVWEALRAIPAGSTASYSEVARRIGLPKSARAVARACASNSIAIAIPCHRVVKHDGSLSGFRWGTGRKKALLDDEFQALSPTTPGSSTS